MSRYRFRHTPAQVKNWDTKYIKEEPDKREAGTKERKNTSLQISEDDGKNAGNEQKEQENETSEMARRRGKTQLETGWREKAGDRGVNRYEMAWSASQLGDREVEREREAARDCERQRWGRWRGAKEKRRAGRRVTRDGRWKLAAGRACICPRERRRAFILESNSIRQRVHQRTLAWH